MEKIDSELLTLKPFSYNNDKYIACVGENGGTDDESILDGFKTTAELIFDNIIEQHGTEDELIYPLVFSIRHCVELSLKISINEIIKIYRRKKEDAPVQTVELHTHDIETISKIVERLYVVDRRIEPLFQVALQYSSDYYFDDKGDAFRYEKGLDDNSILVSKKISQISIGVLREKFKRMMFLFDNAIAFLKGIVAEYSVGTFTKELSRDDIAQVAQSLLPRAKWSDPEFDDCRDAIKEKYQISSNKLSNVIKIIEVHPLFSSYIGVSIPLGTIKESELICYSNLVKWSCKQEMRDAAEGFDVSELLRKLPHEEHERTQIAEAISDEALYSLVAFGDMVQCADIYCENYMKHYEHFKNDDEIKKDYIIHKVEKYNFARLIIKGMEFCGQTEYLKVLRPLINEIIV